MKHKVLHIFSGYGGGISSLILNLVENTKNEIEHSLLAFSYKGGDEFVNRIKACNGTLFLMKRPRVDGVKAFWASIDEPFVGHKYDIVHCHIDGKFVPLFRRVARRNGVTKFVVHAHKTLYEGAFDRNPIGHALNRWCNYHFATHYMTCSQMAADYIFGQHYLNKREVLLIPNGMDDSKFSKVLSSDDRSKYRCELGVEDSELMICHVGRISYQKNHHFILELMAKLKNRGLKYKFIDVGDGELFNTVSKRTKESELDDYVKFVGRRNDIPSIMQVADIVILPSLREGLPTVAIECQASGTPMFLSDTITRQCDMGLGLLKYLSLDLDIWADEIIKFVPYRRSVAECVAQIANKNFTSKSAGKLYVSYIREIINS